MGHQSFLFCKACTPIVPCLAGTVAKVHLNRSASAGRLRSAVERAQGKAEEKSAELQKRVTSPLHDTWIATVLGLALGITFTICFATGLVDYMSQHPPSWFHLPTHPADLYRVNEGLHVITGVATIPLLLAKLWVVWPELLEWPPVRNVAHAVERLSLVPLVGGSLFLLFTGVLNIDYWYSPMGFYFPTAHFWTAWLVVGALVIHISAKTVTVREQLGSAGRRGRVEVLNEREEDVAGARVDEVETADR
jgi:hypothetical protein